MRTTLRGKFMPAVLLSGLLAGSVVAAISAEVRDEAGFFSADAVRRANEIIEDIHRDFKRDLLIETFKGVPESKADEFKKLDADGKKKFFNDWALQRARTSKVNGVYIMLEKNDGHLQVEVGQETRKKAFTLDNREELVSRMVKKLKEARTAEGAGEKQKVYDQALLESVRYVYSAMKTNVGVNKTAIPPVEAGGGSIDAPVNPLPANIPPAHRPSPAPAHVGGGPGLGGILCWGLLVVGIAWIVIGLIRAFTGGGMGGGGGGMGGGGWGGGGGGFFTGLLGGMFGAMAGSWIYNNFFGSGNSWGSGGGWGSSAYGADSPASEPRDTDYSGSGGDFAGGDDAGGGGGDFGGGGDDGGGGDFGGGGGDFGGGGGDFGGGGGDFGGGGGGDF